MIVTLYLWSFSKTEILIKTKHQTLICFQILEVVIFCSLLFAQWRYDLENVVIFLLLVALLGKDLLAITVD